MQYYESSLTTNSHGSAWICYSGPCEPAYVKKEDPTGPRITPAEFDAKTWEEKKEFVKTTPIQDWRASRLLILSRVSETRPTPAA